MKVGLSTWSLLKLDLVRSIRLAGDSGLECIELWGEPPHAYPGRTDVAKIQDALSSYDIGVSVHAPFHDLNPGSVYPPLSRTVSKTLEDFARFSIRLGATTMTFHPGHTFTESLVGDSIRAAVRVLRRVVKKADGALKVNVENEVFNDSGFAFYLGSKSEWLDSILSQVPELGVTLDIGHSNVNGEDPLRFLKKYGSRVTHVHLNNNGGQSDDHRVMGEGTANVGRFLKAASEMNGLRVNLELNPEKYPPKRMLAEAKSLLRRRP